MKFLLFLVSFYLLMINVTGALVYHTTSVTNPESSVTETVKKTVANTTDITQKGILFYVSYSFKFYKWKMLNFYRLEMMYKSSGQEKPLI